MSVWLAENAATIIICIILLVVVVLIIKNLISRHKNGKSSCGGDCSSCGSTCYVKQRTLNEPKVSKIKKN